MDLADLDFELPPDRIAQEPLEQRDAARLLTLERQTGQLGELRFRDLAERVQAPDLLVTNDTRVVPARLRGRKRTGGTAEALVLDRPASGDWRALVKVGGRLREGLELCFGDRCARITEVHGDGLCTLRFEPGESDLLERLGEAPLPPYIRRDTPRPEDLESYQSVFAREPGAVAAPTASLHFTRELAAKLPIATVTLHVGTGTFRPLRSEAGGDLSTHTLDAERFEVPEQTAHAIARTRAEGGRVIAVGTTVVRALETTHGEAGSGETRLFVRPGHRFRVVDSLITNFHLPRSSLLALVMAFAGIEPVRAAYQHAVEAGFRFYSYGDAMWIR